MARIELTTRIAAPVERCFDLSRSVDLHLHSTSRSDEVAIAGRRSGLLEAGEEVTWRAKHLGIRQTLSTRITAYDRPRHFRDSMVRGAFARFDHDHVFEDDGHGGTLMRDVFDFDAPLGPLGWLAERIFLTGYMRRFLEARNRTIREVAESDDWKRFLPRP